jgi:hypothetical protein
MKSAVAICLSVLVSVSVSLAQSAPPTYDEIEAKIHPLTDQQLVECLKTEPKSCILDYRDFDMIIGELGDRNNPDLLITAYKKATEDDRYYLVKALYQIDDPEVLTFMRSIAFEHLSRGMDDSGSFFPLDYLAQRCDQPALARLNRHVNFKRYTPMACTYWAGTVRSFGTCNYRAAAANLVRSLDAACLNITGAAEEGLHKFFPGACLNPDSIQEEQHCYKNLLRDQPKPQMTND